MDISNCEWFGFPRVAMMNLSEETRRIVNQLYALNRSRAWFGERLRGSNIVCLLDELVNQGEPKALPCAAIFLASPNATIRTAARCAVSTLLRRMPVDLGLLQHTVRQ